MAKFVLKDAYVNLNVNSTDYDLSDHVESVTVEGTQDTPESTSMGDDWRTVLGGLKAFSVALNFRQDYAANEVDAALWAAFEYNDTGTSTITVRPTSSAVSTTNPQWSGGVLLPTYQGVGGSVGDVAAASVTLQGSGALTRATS